MLEMIIKGVRKEYQSGVTFQEIAEEYAASLDAPAALVYFNGKMTELFKKPEKGGILEFITVKESAGHNTYCRTAEMILIKAVENLAARKTGISGEKTAHVKIEFALGNAVYCTVSVGNTPVDETLAGEIEEEMKRIVEEDLPLRKRSCPIDRAKEIFAEQGMFDKVELFRYRRSSSVNVYELDGFYDYFYGHMLPSTGMVDTFAVQKYKEGIILILPTMEHPGTLEPFTEQNSLFEQLDLSTKWGELIGITTVGELNRNVCAGRFNELILVQEALQERRIGEIAASVHARHNVKFVMIAGPSSSGKTTFANRLSVQLRTFGYNPRIISMDDYFVDRENTPRDADGSYNFDVIEAVDLEQFNHDMKELVEGNKVELPVFDFKKGKRVYKGKIMKLEENDILIIEGIHGLNPRSSEKIPAGAAYKIYISAMTSLNIDDHNRIPSTDVRLIRRMVRDARTRSNTAQMTIDGWKKVHEGEKINIFPYQDQADSVFNSAICYELGVLKHYAEPLLFHVQKEDPSYYEAKRLLKFFDYFVGIDDHSIPSNSLCKEFVGGGCFGLG